VDDAPPITAYAVELLFEATPHVDAAAVEDALRRRCPDAWLDRDESGGLHIVHAQHQVELADGDLPARTVLLAGAGSLDAEELEPALWQSRTFPEARSVAGRCGYSLLLVELLARCLPRRERLAIFQDALLALLEAVPCQAVHWKLADRLVDPSAYLEAADVGFAELFFAGALNVRMFTLPDGDLLMDTLGLSPLGLPDVQCHFRELDPDRMAQFLADVAWYLFECGDVIADGETVEGFAGDRRWFCQHELGAITKRPVLDVHPGPRYAAGERSGAV
jgi:hypothetical protein